MRMARAGRSSRMGGRMGGRMAFGQDLLADEGAGPGDPVSQQMSALGNIFNSKFQHPEVKFIGINTNSPRTAPAVVARLLQSPMPWAQAMLNSPAVASAFMPALPQVSLRLWYLTISLVGRQSPLKLPATHTKPRRLWNSKRPRPWQELLSKCPNRCRKVWRIRRNNFGYKPPKVPR